MKNLKCTLDVESKELRDGLDTANEQQGNKNNFPG